ncbi:MAG: FHA domain-containing protein [Bdellovibrionales bacterium]
MSAAPVLSSALRLKLKVTSGPHLNEIYSLESKTTKIGRAEDNDIKLVNDGRISRHHVEIYLVHSQFKFKNISQKNFVTIDGKVLEEGILLPGQLLQVGETTFEVFSDGPELVSNEEVISPTTSDDKSIVTVRVPLQAPVKPVVVRPAPLKPQNSSPSPTPLRPMPMGNPTAPLRPSPQPLGATQISRPSPSRSAGGDNRLTFYIIILAAIGFFVFLALGPTKPKEAKTFRTSQQVEYDLLQSSDEKKKLQERLETMHTTADYRELENFI